jgi:hypothetical protein
MRLFSPKTLFRRIANKLVACDATHCEFEVYERCTIDILGFRLPRQLAGMALKIGREHHVVGGVGNCGDFPLGCLTQFLEGSSPLLSFRSGPIDDLNSDVAWLPVAGGLRWN